MDIQRKTELPYLDSMSFGGSSYGNWNGIQMSAIRNLLFLILLLICRCHAEWYDENEKAFYEVIKNFSLHGGRSTDRLIRRSEGMMKSSTPRPLILQFDAQGKRFAIRLKENESILGEHTKVRIHGRTSGDMLEAPIYGKAYVGERMVVVDKELLMSKLGAEEWHADLIKLMPQEGATVSEELFGRFYIDQSRTTDSIAGGFIFNGKYMSIQSVSHPIAKMAAMHIKSYHSLPENSKDDLIVSIQSLADMDQEYKNHTRRCGHDHLKYNRDPKGASSFFAKKLLETSGKILGGTGKLYARSASGCPSADKVIYVGVVADCNYVAEFKGDLEKAKANIINDFNLASAIFEENFNIDLGILSIDLMTECNNGKHFNVPCSTRIPLDERLSRFSKWRGTQSADAGLYHLVSGCSDGSIVGIAWLNQVCQVKSVTSTDGENVSGAAVTVFVKNQFSVITHEIAHNFGAVHDCDKDTCLACVDGVDCQCCPCGAACDCRGKFIMDPESGGRNVQKFSDCTVKDICRKVPVLAAACLRERGTLRTITNAQCGNGIKEEGEECDCGGPEKCKSNPCCTEECKLKPGAVCSDENDGCCKSCKIITAGAKKICTPSEGKCQVDSFCDGVSATCPVTKPLPDGTVCADDGNTCASGQCTSRTSQCLAVGTRLGFKGDCPSASASCSMTCMTAKGCVALEAYFVDGTPCGHSGKCYLGQCDEAVWISLIWRYSYLIGFIAIVLALTLLAALIKGLINCYRRR